MIALPIITTIIMGFFAFCCVVFIFDAADTNKEIRVATMFLISCIWVITISWILYYN